jgi:hypothetical protein
LSAFCVRGGLHRQLVQYEVEKVARAVLWGGFRQPCEASLGINCPSLLIVPAAPHLMRHTSMACRQCRIRCIKLCAVNGWSPALSLWISQPDALFCASCIRRRVVFPSRSITAACFPFLVFPGNRISPRGHVAYYFYFSSFVLCLISRCVCPLSLDHFFAYAFRSTPSNRFLKIGNGSVGISFRPTLPPELCSSAEP